MSADAVNEFLSDAFSDVGDAPAAEAPAAEPVTAEAVAESTPRHESGGAVTNADIARTLGGTDDAIRAGILDAPTPGRAPTKPAAAPEPTAEDHLVAAGAEAILKLGIDPDTLAAYVERNPDITRISPNTPEEAAAIIGQAEKTRLLEEALVQQREQTSQWQEHATKTQALREAIDDYQAGDADPADIAAHLLENTPRAYDEFVAHWAEHDPDSAVSWSQQLAAALQHARTTQEAIEQGQAALAQQAQQAEVQAAWQAQQADHARAVGEFVAGHEHLRGEIGELLAQAGPKFADAVDSAGIDGALTALAVHAQELQRARSETAFLNGLVGEARKRDWRNPDPTPITVAPDFNFNVQHNPTTDEDVNAALVRLFAPTPMQQAGQELQAAVRQARLDQQPKPRR